MFFARLLPFSVMLAIIHPLPSLADGIGTASIEAADTSFPALISGSGEPVIFVHGLFVDDRAWSKFEPAVAKDHLFIAYTQRGFGAATWQDATFTRDQHTKDLIAVLRAIEKPANLVGWSYGGPIVLRAAAEVPDKVRRIVLYEPYVPEMLGGTPEAEAAAESFWGLWGATEEALEAGDETKALKASIEAANGLPIGGFAAQAPAVQTMQLENKHTVRLNWDAPEPKVVTCEELSMVRAQTLVITGSRTLPAYTEIGKAVAACVPGATIAVLEGSGHEAPVAGAPDLIDMVLDFIEAQ